MDQLTSLKELSSELQFDSERYLRTYGFIDPLQYGEEQRWQQLHDSFQKRALHGGVLKTLFVSFGERIAALLDCRLSPHLAERKEAERKDVLCERQILLTNVRDSVFAIIEMWQHCERETTHTFPLKSVTVDPMEFDDIQPVKTIEADLHTRPWKGVDFHRLKKLQSPKPKIEKLVGVTYHLRTAKADFYKKRMLGFRQEEDVPLKVIGYSVIRETRQETRFQMGPTASNVNISVLEVQTLGTNPEYGEIPLNALLSDMIAVWSGKSRGVLRNGIQNAHGGKEQ